jgi:hypothetical protein
MTQPLFSYPLVEIANKHIPTPVDLNSTQASLLAGWSKYVFIQKANDCYAVLHPSKISGFNGKITIIWEAVAENFTMSFVPMVKMPCMIGNDYGLIEEMVSTMSLFLPRLALPFSEPVFLTEMVATIPADISPCGIPLTMYVSELRARYFELYLFLNSYLNNLGGQ